MPFKSWALMHRPCVRLVSVRLVILCLIEVPLFVVCLNHPAKRSRWRRGDRAAAPPTRDVMKFACTIVDPANSPQSSSLQTALQQRGFPCTRVVCKAHDVLAQGCAYQALQAMQVFSHTLVSPPAWSLRLTGKQCRRLGEEVHQ